MKHPNDKYTIDAFADEKRRVGRPLGKKPPVSNAQRMREYRARLKQAASEYDDFYRYEPR